MPRGFWISILSIDNGDSQQINVTLEEGEIEPRAGLTTPPRMSVSSSEIGRSHAAFTFIFNPSIYLLPGVKSDDISEQYD
ncbi:MAG: hypothetical protein ABSH20_13350 [Tepidisphaeraceae bacterium]